jgi:hypothetical protein
MSNTFMVFRQPATGTVAVRVINKDATKTRSLTEAEMAALIGLLNESEFEQHIDQAEIQN